MGGSMTSTMEQQRQRAEGDFERFTARVNALVERHPVVTDNRYCTWFAQGQASAAQVKDLLVQFSVFSNLFIVAQLLKTINAPSLAQSRQSCEILVNELGVIFNGTRASGMDHDAAGDPALVATEGTVDGGTYRFGARHFEWLLRVGESVGLGFDDLGKRRHGTEATLFFCDELARIYGSDDPDLAEGASYAVEHWAAAGFWKQLIAGLEVYKAQQCPSLRLSFFTWHDRVEANHAAHTDDELAEAFVRPGFDEERFCLGATEMLHAVEVFWNGLDTNRVTLGGAHHG